MSTESTTETACHVLWHYGHRGGYQPGRFTRLLMQAIDAADVTHTARLAGAYPELVEAMNLAANREDGIAQLKKAAGLACIRCGDEDGPFAGAPRQPLCEPCARPMPLDAA